MTKPYHEMTSAERLAVRIAKNREIEQKIQSAPVVVEKTRRRKTAEDVRTTSRNNTLDKFHEIRKLHGIDAASEYLRNMRNEEAS